jgi:hypothetical protein
MLQESDESDLFLNSQQCLAREGDGAGYQCELPDDHVGPHTCPVALENFLKFRYPDSRNPILKKYLLSSLHGRFAEPISPVSVPSQEGIK